MTDTSPFDEWVKQAREICPGVSEAAIRLDLEVTKSVEVTIDRIFDGRVQVCLLRTTSM